MSTKILVISDIHSEEDIASRILEREKDSNVIVFLGDGERNFELAMAENKLDICGNVRLKVYQVAGNCDWYSLEPMVLQPEIACVKFCITHGHGHGVKSKTGIISLAEYASASGCKVALFGHTHRQFLDEISEVKMFNPGAAQNGQYGVVTITGDSGIKFEHRGI